MATHASAEKAARQAEKRRERNSAARAKVRTQIKNLRAAISNKSLGKDEAKKVLVPLLNQTQSILMKAASKNLIKRGTAARYISRLSQAVARVS
jgi:small subunit ribosomal protein S20